MLTYCGAPGSASILTSNAHVLPVRSASRGRIALPGGVLATVIMPFRAAINVYTTDENLIMTANEMSGIKLDMLKVSSNRSEDGFPQAEGEGRTGAYFYVCEDSTDPEARRKSTAAGWTELCVEDTHGQS